GDVEQGADLIVGVDERRGPGRAGGQQPGWWDLDPGIQQLRPGGEESDRGQPQRLGTGRRAGGGGGEPQRLLDGDVLTCRSALTLTVAGAAIQVVGEREQDVTGALEPEPQSATRGQVVSDQCPQSRRPRRIAGHRGPP